ncbi:MAG: ABC transporter ATP-binding protein [Terriglobia bacterium]|nr:ABC transporter ATP-binding protein [Terriglobia bacterium]
MRKHLPSSWLPEQYRWLAEQIRPFLGWHLGSFLCVTAGSVLGLLSPFVLKWLIDQALPKRNLGLLAGLAVVFFITYEGRTLLTSCGAYLNLNASQRLNLALSMRVLRHLNLLSASYYESTAVGTAIYPLKQPVEEIAYFGSDLLPAILRLFLTGVFTLFAMFMLSPMLTVTVLPLIPAFLIARLYFRTRLGSDSDAVQCRRLVWSTFLEEHLSAIVPIQLLRQQRQQERKAFRLLASTARSEQKLFRTGIRFTVFTSLAVVLAMTWVIGCGGWSVLSGTLTVGGLVAFYGFVTQLFEPLSSAAELYARAQKTFASMRYVQSVLALRPAITDSPGAAVLSQEHTWQVDFHNVEFGYQRQKNMLRIPSLRICSGEQIAIVGENGAGKSTLVKLLARVYDADSGSVSIGGWDVRSIQLDSLRRFVAYLPRDPVLFDGAIARNLRFVKPSASDDELWRALGCTELSSFIAQLPDGIDQGIGPGGCQLSGGQRQRLAIARTLLARPRIVVLDEATSCLDPLAEETVIRNLRHELPTSTLIVISHRISTVSNFDRVLALADGQILHDGRVGSFGFRSGTASTCDR